MGAETLLESDDEIEITTSDLELLYDESESSMDAETSSVVNVFENVSNGPAQSSQECSVANKEIEQSETPPLVEHITAPHEHVRAPPPLVSLVSAGNPHGTAHPGNNKAGPSTPRYTASPPRIDFELGRESRVTPSSNIGNFKSVNPVTPVIGSYATSSGLVRVPVLDHNRLIVTSSNPKFFCPVRHLKAECLYQQSLYSWSS